MTKPKTTLLINGINLGEVADCRMSFSLQNDYIYVTLHPDAIIRLCRQIGMPPVIPPQPKETNMALLSDGTINVSHATHRPRLRLYEYAVLLHPNQQEADEGLSTRIVVGPSTLLAVDAAAVGFKATREVPEEYAGRVGDLEFAIHPF